MPTKWHIRLTKWSKLNDQEAIKSIREQVFINEQNVPVELEWDNLDEQCLHCLVSDADGISVATARLLQDKKHAHIGRMAVLKPYRQQGIGSMMLTTLLEQAKKIGVIKIDINAQTSAMSFYQRAGFIAVGDKFDDAGIPHYKMTLQLGKY